MPLSLGRKTDETVILNDTVSGNKTVITVKRVGSGRVCLAVDAPDTVDVDRGEVIARGEAKPRR